MSQSSIRHESPAGVDRVIREHPVVARSERLAAEFGEINAELIAIVSGCKEEEWQSPSVDEGWPIGVVAHHVAIVIPAFIRIVQQIAAGAILTIRVSMEEVHEGNARHALECADVRPAEVLELLKTHGGECRHVLSDLSDEQLAITTAAFPGRELSLAEVVERIVIGHSRQHLASLRATLAG